MEVIHGYREDPALRSSFNALAEETFGLNFEHWFRLGYWGDNYDPHSVVVDGKIVANVSVNRTDLRIGGEVRRIYQLGTVMTGPEYRNRGYIRAIMAEVEKTCAGADGVYLFANDSVLEFYPKFGFCRGTEYVYSKEAASAGERRMERFPMDTPENRDRLARAMAESRFQTACEMVGNPGLIFFYAAQFMADCVYHWPEKDLWAIAEEEDGVLTLHNVFGPDVALEEVIAAFGHCGPVTLGFAPADPSGWEKQELHEEDCTFFVKGSGFGDFAGKGLRIPTLSHA